MSDFAKRMIEDVGVYITLSNKEVSAKELEFLVEQTVKYVAMFVRDDLDDHFTAEQIEERFDVGTK
jgi:hypothetical protein